MGFREGMHKAVRSEFAHRPHFGAVCVTVPEDVTYVIFIEQREVPDFLASHLDWRGQEEEIESWVQRGDCALLRSNGGLGQNGRADPRVRGGRTHSPGEPTPGCCRGAVRTTWVPLNHAVE